jgi:peptidoglycan/LPS O-acetylase OafA/YrhL
VGNRREHLPALTGLRFVLALWVILNHLIGNGMMLDAQARALPPFLFALVRGGYLAVTTFFVLSGFVLARNYAETTWSRESLLRYGVGRLARVYPVYALSLLVMAPFISEDRAPAKGQLLAEHGLLLQGWTGPLPVSWNTPAWSLSCEMFFYLLFPAAAILILRSAWPATLAAAVFACCLTPILWRLGVPDEMKALVHISDFLMGIAAARAYDLLASTGMLRDSRGAWLYLPSLALAAALIAFPAILPQAADLNSVLRPLNALLVIGLAAGGGVIARSLSTRAAVYLGKSSYAMYILHVPLLWWFLRWSGASATAYLALVVGASALVYRAVEEPANRWLRSRFHRALQA